MSDIAADTRPHLAGDPFAHAEGYRQAAKRLYYGHGGTFSDGDIDIDSDAVVSESDEGAYVAAWVWVPATETP